MVHIKKLYHFLIEMQIICNLIDRKSVHITIIFNCYSAKIDETQKSKAFKHLNSH